MNLRHDVRLRTKSNKFVDLLTVAENQHGRDRHDLEHGAKSALFIDVDLDDLDVVTKLARDIIEDWGKLLARATPFSPEVNDDRLGGGGLDYFGTEGVGGYVFLRCS